jgi:capsular polysaccharide biosynthesis protein
MKSNEFSPYEYFSHIINLWWVVFVATLVGGALGFAFFHLHPALYEATATYIVTIDLNRFPMQGIQEDLIQYNEDLAINTTQDAFISDEVLNEVVSQLKEMGISLTVADLVRNYTIERKHELWEIRYRSQVPSEAQTIVNTWAEIGYQVILSWQTTGMVPSFVIFKPLSQALVPTRPVLYGRNNLILAGAVIGFVLGILVSARLNHPQKISLSGK